MATVPRLSRIRRSWVPSPVKSPTPWICQSGSASWTLPKPSRDPDILIETE